jgi:DNA-binding transcriptional ArsR family regulator
MGDYRNHPPNGRLEGETSRGPRLSDDGLYDALASRIRRRVLYLLLVEEETTVDRIATVLVGWDAAGSGRLATPDDRDEVRTGLRHKHLPRLEDCGFVDYDREAGRVSLEPLVDPVIDLVRRSIETERARGR